MYRSELNSDIVNKNLTLIGTGEDTAPFSGDLSGYTELNIVITLYKNAQGKILITYTIPTYMFEESTSITLNFNNALSPSEESGRLVLTSNSATLTSLGSSTIQPKCWIFGRK